MKISDIRNSNEYLLPKRFRIHERFIQALTNPVNSLFVQLIKCRIRIDHRGKCNARTNSKTK